MSNEEAKRLYERLKREAEAAGYYLNPDTSFVLDLMQGLIANQKRYGYLACPCRLSDGVREKDLDIICPCDYRDPDLEDHGACYCALYVSEEVLRGEKRLKPVPERRGIQPAKPPGKAAGQRKVLTRSEIPIWRCKVCGYLCARPEPPLKCPICKVDQDRFERLA